jgi:activating signal cointegrator 1
MHAISIWNPFASLLANGFKSIETRGWPAPKRLIGKRIGIASTKVIKPEQRTPFQDPKFMFYYEQTGLPQLCELPHGYLLATAILHSCDIIEESDLDDITEEEQLYGWFEVGRYAWRMRAVEALSKPLPVQGKQGIWEVPDSAVTTAEVQRIY